MTTVNKAHDLFLSFQGKSLRDIYTQRCSELKCKPNSALLKNLSTDINDFTRTSIECGKDNYLGATGVRALLPLIQANLSLECLDLSGAGVNDAALAELVEVLTDHPRVDTLVFDNNPDMSTRSGKLLVKLLRVNAHILSISASGTHVGVNVNNVLRSRAAKNAQVVEKFFRADWCYMRSLFLTCDSDGSGKISVDDIKVNAPHPRLRDHVARCAYFSHRRSSTSAVDIDVTLFLQSLYPNFLPLTSIEPFCLGTGTGTGGSGSDDDTSSSSSTQHYDVMKRNWVTLVKLFPSVTNVTDLRRFRIMMRVLNEDVLRQHESYKAETTDIVEIWRFLRSLGVLDSQIENNKTGTTATTTSNWVLPQPMASEVFKLFNGRRSMALSEFLETTPSTAYEVLKMKRLVRQLTLCSIPTSETTLTVEEAVNLCNEQYSVLSVGIYGSDE
eukprot:PhM_4_TR5974/c0_g1_i2/m.37914